jgi:hypothetical protein
LTIEQPLQKDNRRFGRVEQSFFDRRHLAFVSYLIKRRKHHGERLRLATLSLTKPLNSFFVSRINNQVEPAETFQSNNLTCADVLD